MTTLWKVYGYTGNSRPVCEVFRTVEAARAYYAELVVRSPRSDITIGEVTPEQVKQMNENIRKFQKL